MRRSKIRGPREPSRVESSRRTSRAEATPRQAKVQVSQLSSEQTGESAALAGWRAKQMNPTPCPVSSARQTLGKLACQRRLRFTASKLEFAPFSAKSACLSARLSLGRRLSVFGLQQRCQSARGGQTCCASQSHHLQSPICGRNIQHSTSTKQHRETSNKQRATVGNRRRQDNREKPRGDKSSSSLCNSRRLAAAARTLVAQQQVAGGAKSGAPRAES